MDEITREMREYQDDDCEPARLDTMELCYAMGYEHGQAMLTLAEVLSVVERTNGDIEKWQHDAIVGGWTAGRDDVARWRADMDARADEPVVVDGGNSLYPW